MPQILARGFGQLPSLDRVYGDLAGGNGLVWDAKRTLGKAKQKEPSTFAHLTEL